MSTIDIDHLFLMAPVSRWDMFESKIIFFIVYESEVGHCSTKNDCSYYESETDCETVSTKLELIWIALALFPRSFVLSTFTKSDPRKNPF